MFIKIIRPHLLAQSSPDFKYCHSPLNTPIIPMSTTILPHLPTVTWLQLYSQQLASYFVKGLLVLGSSEGLL